MVVGGTLAAAFISYEPRYVLMALKLIGRIVFSTKVGRNILKSEVGRVIRWAYTVQKSGIPALESESKKAVKGDKFLQFGVEMVVSGYTGDEVREILTNTIETTYGRKHGPGEHPQCHGGRVSGVRHDRNIGRPDNHARRHGRRPDAVGRRLGRGAVDHPLRCNLRAFGFHARRNQDHAARADRTVP